MTKQLINAYNRKSIYIIIFNIYNYIYINIITKKDPIIMNVGMKMKINKLIVYLRQSKKKYFSAFINMYGKNINVIWKMINTITYGNMLTISILN